MLGKRQKLKYEIVANKTEETVDLEPIKHKSFNSACIWSSLSTGLLIVVYFVPSISLTFYQRWLFQVRLFTK